jgi:hypothetical protein
MIEKSEHGHAKSWRCDACGDMVALMGFDGELVPELWRGGWEDLGSNMHLCPRCSDSSKIPWQHDQEDRGRHD